MGKKNKNKDDSRFRLSDMLPIPNAWFHKLKALTIKPTPTPTNHTTVSSCSSGQQQPQLLHQRKSNYFTRDLTTTTPSPPTTKQESLHKKPTTTSTSSAIRSRVPPLQSQPVSSSGCRCRASATNPPLLPPELDSTPEVYPNSALETSSSSSSSSTATTDKNDNESMVSQTVPAGSMISRSPLQTPPVRSASEFKLPPIKTNVHRKSPAANAANCVSSAREEEEEEQSTPTASSRRLSVTSLQGLKLRTNSPRIGNRRIVTNQSSPRRRRRRRTAGTKKRRSLSESFAVVKASRDPKRDFMESMVEMIVENNLRGSRDLEDLLACYLSLNSTHYHDMIIGVFKQIWFDIVVLDVN